MDERGLKRLIKNAKARVKVGGKYIHFKNPEHVYLVLDIAIDQEHKALVIYKGLYGEHLTWARPVDEFAGSIILKDKKVKRFTLVRPS